MKRRIMLFAVFHTVQKLRDPEEIPVLNAFCDSCQLLINDPSGTHVQMPDLGIAHLTVRKTYGKA